MGEDSSPEARDHELRRRLEVLKEQFEQGKVSIAAPIADEMERSLLSVRYGPDGRIDLLTVDSRVRAFSLAVTATRDREEMKRSISLREIQQTYFSWLETNFGEYYQMMVDRELTPHQVGKIASRKADVVQYTASVIPKFVEMLTEFWERLLSIFQPKHCCKMWLVYRHDNIA